MEIPDDLCDNYDHLSLRADPTESIFWRENFAHKELYIIVICVFVC